MNRASATDAPRILIEEQFQSESPVQNGGIIPIARYRKLTGDFTSTDARVVERLQYLEQFCRVIIQTELDKYAERNRNKTPKSI
jgi:hypothetical protein